MKNSNKYFEIPVTIVAMGETEEDARLRAYLFMPWTTDGREWNLKGHEALLGGISVDSWFMQDVDSDEMEAKLLENGWR